MLRLCFVLLICLVFCGCDNEQATDIPPANGSESQSSTSTDGAPDGEDASGAGSQQQQDNSGSTGDSDPDTESGASESEADNSSEGTRLTLFDGTMDGWEEGVFGASDECCIEDGNLVLESGYPMSGVATLREDLPTNNYEVELEAMKMVGNDFFCALTFPVDDSHCTFVCGGWGGATTGLSCVDGNDASDNDTKTFRQYENDRWYKIRVRVTTEKIECWVDDDQAVDLVRTGHEIGIRMECNACKPLGIASFETRAAFRNITLTQLEETE